MQEETYFQHLSRISFKLNKYFEKQKSFQNKHKRDKETDHGELNIFNHKINHEHYAKFMTGEIRYSQIYIQLPG